MSDQLTFQLTIPPVFTSGYPHQWIMTGKRFSADGSQKGLTEGSVRIEGPDLSSPTSAPRQRRNWIHVQVKNAAHETMKQGQHGCRLHVDIMSSFRAPPPRPSSKWSWTTLLQTPPGQRPVPRTPGSIQSKGPSAFLNTFYSISPKLLILRPPPQHHSPWHTSMDTHFIETWYKTKVTWNLPPCCGFRS